MLEIIAPLHKQFANTALYFALALAVWGAWNYFRGKGVSGNYFGALVVGELLMIAQDVLGVLQFASGPAPRDPVHFLYGLLNIIAWPGVYAYTGGKMERREQGLYAVVSFFLFGVSLRAIMTGR